MEQNAMTMTSPEAASLRNRSPGLTVDVARINEEHVDGGKYDPKTPPGVRGHLDVRAPGFAKTPLGADGEGRSGFDNEDGSGEGGNGVLSPSAAAAAAPAADEPTSPLADFITQTDKYGNATTPRTAESIAAARRMHPTGPKPHLHVDEATGALTEEEGEPSADAAAGSQALLTKAADDLAGRGQQGGEDACDTLLDSFRDRKSVV